MALHGGGLPANIGRVIAQSSTAQSLTGSTSETTMVSVTIPGGIMGANGQLEITTHWSYPNSANNKTLRVKYGSTAYTSAVVTTTTQSQNFTRICNVNATNSQKGGPGGSTSLGTSTNAVATSAVDTTADSTLLITGQLANSGETLVLESYIVKVFPAS